jgi:uncharacterized repeat protein (TIGR03806 family)
MRRPAALRTAGCALLSVCLFASCGRFLRPDVEGHIEGPFPQKLSAWHLFTAHSPALKPNRGVIPYENTPLFSDYSDKYRFVWISPGTSAHYRDDGPFEFPVGTVLAKTFAFPVGERSAEKLIETRLLVHSKAGWVALPYVWDEKQSDATLQLVPDPVRVKWTDASARLHDFNYLIPNANECRECHENQNVLLPIGPKARNLNRELAYEDSVENQLEHWARVGYLQGLPATAARPRGAKWDDPGSGSVTDRARAYLDNNCAHCHQPGGQAGYTGVDLRLTQADPGAPGILQVSELGWAGGRSTLRRAAGTPGRIHLDFSPGIHGSESFHAGAGP